MQDLGMSEKLNLSRRGWGVLVTSSLAIFAVIGLYSISFSDDTNDTATSNVKAYQDEFSSVEIEVVEGDSLNSLGLPRNPAGTAQPEPTASVLQQSPTPAGWQPVSGQESFLPTTPPSTDLLNSANNIN